MNTLRHDRITVDDECARHFVCDAYRTCAAYQYARKRGPECITGRAPICPGKEIMSNIQMQRLFIDMCNERCDKSRRKWVFAYYEVSLEPVAEKYFVSGYMQCVVDS
jgi:hypothetical protein